MIFYKLSFFESTESQHPFSASKLCNNALIVKSISNSLTTIYNFPSHNLSANSLFTQSFRCSLYGRHPTKSDLDEMSQWMIMTHVRLVDHKLFGIQCFISFFVLNFFKSVNTFNISFKSPNFFKTHCYTFS